MESHFLWCISDEQVIPIGKRKLHQQEKTLAVIAAELVCCTLEANIKLKELGISAEVIDLRTIRPIDFETIIESIKRQTDA